MNPQIYKILISDDGQDIAEYAVSGRHFGDRRGYTTTHRLECQQYFFGHRKLNSITKHGQGQQMFVYRVSCLAPILADSYLWSPVSRRSGGAAYPGYPRLICPSSMRSRAAKVSRDT